MRKLLFFCLLLISQMTYSQTLFDTIMSRIHADETNRSVLLMDQIAGRRLSTITSTGTWPKVAGDRHDYHLEHIIDMARAYTCVGSVYKDNPQMFNAILSAVNAWRGMGKNIDDWFMRDITLPTCTGTMLILMRFGANRIPPDIEKELIGRMKSLTFKGGDGSNTSETAVHFVYKGLLTKDRAMLDKGKRYVFESITYDQGDLHEDNSFSLHGNQLYLNGYGRKFVSVAYRMASLFEGTEIALARYKMNMLNKFYLDTYLKAGKAGYPDWASYGRGIVRGEGTEHPRTVRINTEFLNYAKVADPANPKWKLVEEGSYHNQPAHNRYWQTDFDLHLRPGYTFSLRTASNRSLRTERSTNENMLAKYVSDGSTDIQRLGPEYKNIYGIWEWDKIPGTTSRDHEGDVGAFIGDPAVAKWNQELGSTSFVGGVTDSLYGATAYHMSYQGVSAKKSWFFFDQEVVCMGAGIKSAAAEPVATTVNQCWLFGDIGVSSASGITNINNASNSITPLISPKWVLHDSIGYFFPSGGNVKVSNQIQHGNWYRIGTAFNDDAPVEGTVFKMWFDHGIKPGNSTYEYIVVPNVGSEDMDTYKISDIKIDKNTDSIQAVRHLGLDMLQVIFYKAGTFITDNISVVVDKPCVLMFKNLSASRVIMSIADPAQQTSLVNVSFKLPGIPGKERMLNARLLGPAGSSTRYTLSSENKEAAIRVLTAIADSHVSSSSATAGTNYGSSMYLALDNQPSSDLVSEVFLKFDPRAIKRPISNAKIRMYVNRGDQNATSSEWGIYSVGNNWTETAINWKNKPASQQAIATHPGQITAGYIDWDITPAINSLHPDSLFSIKLSMSNIAQAGFGRFGSKESENKPTLEINTVAPKQENLSVIGDAYVSSRVADASKNFGSSSRLYVMPDIHDAFLKFNLNSTHGKVISAKLKLKRVAAYDNGSEISLYGVSDNNWTENGVNWNNKPLADGSLIGSSKEKGTVSLDVTALLKNVSEEGLLSLKLLAPTGALTGYLHSNQAADATFRPVLECIVDTTNFEPEVMLAKTEMFAVKSRVQVLQNSNLSEEKSDTVTDLFPANLLTPNGDGRNDTWQIKNISLYPKNSVKVFTINGQLILDKQSYDNSWNATYNGALVPDGAYVYIIDKGDQSPLIKGVLNVIAGFK